MRRPARLLLLLPLLFVAGCDTGEDDRFVGGVNVSELFRAPRTAERQALLTDWAARDVSAQNVTVEATYQATAQRVVGSPVRFNVTIVGHTVGGVRHYGAILVPADLAVGTLVPVLVYAHGGDNGTSAEEGAAVAGLVMPHTASFVVVVPSFRDEPLRFNGQTRTSAGPASPWDRDVDDALALLNVALARTPQADAARIGAVGFSRGATVAMLMAIREPRLKRVLEMFGPTDFYGDYVREIVEGALSGTTYNLPGFDVLNERFVQPLRAGTVTVEAMRAELLRRSPVYFTDRLPAVQVQHGDADETVAVSQAQRLINTMKTRAEFSYFIWAGGQHNPATFPINWLGEAQNFLAQL
jgi:dipeptidyl aminopeptidase/acylaminoacyl peptidase